MKAVPSFLAVALCCIALPAMAKDDLYSRQYGLCIDKTGGSIYAMLDCSEQELARQDKKLNANYKKAMALVGKDLGKEGQNALRQAQRTWLKWREEDSGVYVLFYDYYDQMARLNRMSGYLEKTAQRARDLETLIQMME